MLSFIKKSTKLKLKIKNVNKDGGYRYYHSKEVELLAHFINNEEKLNLNKEILSIVALFHDYCKDEKKHGKKASKELKMIIEMYKSEFTEDYKNIMLECIEMHSEKKVKSDNKYLKVLKDADRIAKFFNYLDEELCIPNIKKFEKKSKKSFSKKKVIFKTSSNIMDNVKKKYEKSIKKINKEKRWIYIN